MPAECIPPPVPAKVREFLVFTRAYPGLKVEAHRFSVGRAGTLYFWMGLTLVRSYAKGEWTQVREEA